MSVFRIKRVRGEFDHCGDLSVEVIGGDVGDFLVTLCHKSGPLAFQFSMTSEQSASLRKALEDAEAKAEILNVAI
jgi:hypothetical protein